MFGRFLAICARNEELRVQLLSPKGDALGSMINDRVKITVWDHDATDADDPMGFAMLRLSELEASWHKPTWINLCELWPLDRAGGLQGATSALSCLYQSRSDPKLN